MSTRWRKIAGDFRQHRAQVGLVGLVLLLGTAGVMAALNARTVLAREIAASYARALAPDFALWFDRVDDRLLADVRAMPGVAAADTRRICTTRIEGRGGGWLPARLLVVRDFSDQRTGLLHQHGGAWPAEGGGILIEQSSLPLLPVGPGAPLRIRTPGGGTATLPITGIVHDTAVAPSTQERIIYAYLTPAAAARIGQGAELDQLVVRMEDRGSGVSEFANDLRDTLAASNRAPVRVEVLPYGHPHAALMNAMLRVLGVMAAMAFVSSVALAAFVVSLWMKRETRQVGIMKAIGARSGQLAGLYLALVAPVVVCAALLAVPLGRAAGGALVRYYEWNLNIDVADPGAPAGLWLAEIAGALILPLAAMAGPIARACRLTVREAINDPGITAPGGPRWRATRLLRVPGHRPWTFALRNTLRRPGRLALTLLALSSGGALLLTSSNLYASLMNVVDRALAEQGHDLEVSLPRPVAAGRLEALARAVPGVEIAEAWRRAGVGLVTGPEEEELGRAPHRFPLTAYPPGTRLLALPAREGRWPRPDETDAAVVTRFVQNQVRGLRVGDTVTLQFREKSFRVRIVGLVDELVTPMIYTNLPAYQAITGLGDTAVLLRVKAAQPAATAAALDDALLDARIPAAQMQTRADKREVLDEHFLVVTTVAEMVALAAALAGGICLSAFACLNVLDRAREIGVLRTLGATPRMVTAIFLAESGAIAALSAGLAFALSLWATHAMNEFSSRQLLQVAVPLVVSAKGLAWAAGGGVLVLLGVWLPVARLLRGTVRDTLAYE